MSHHHACRQPPQCTVKQTPVDEHNTFATCLNMHQGQLMVTLSSVDKTWRCADVNSSGNRYRILEAGMGPNNDCVLRPAMRIEDASAERSCTMKMLRSNWGCENSQRRKEITSTARGKNNIYADHVHTAAVSARRLQSNAAASTAT